jgi:hypothetical protein
MTILDASSHALIAIDAAGFVIGILSRKRGLPAKMLTAFFGGSFCCGLVEAVLWSRWETTEWVTLAWDLCAILLLVPAMVFAGKVTVKNSTKLLYILALMLVIGGAVNPYVTQNPGFTHMVVCISAVTLMLNAKSYYCTVSLLAAFGVDSLVYSIPVSWWRVIIPELVQVARNIIWLIAMVHLITTYQRKPRRSEASQPLTSKPE